MKKKAKKKEVFVLSIYGGNIAVCDMEHISPIQKIVAKAEECDTDAIHVETFTLNEVVLD